jgi:hypothetical protein
VSAEPKIRFPIVQRIAVDVIDKCSFRRIQDEPRHWLRPMFARSVRFVPHGIAAPIRAERPTPTAYALEIFIVNPRCPVFGKWNKFHPLYYTLQD